jgi:hypothetical protein
VHLKPVPGCRFHGTLAAECQQSVLHFGSRVSARLLATADNMHIDAAVQCQQRCRHQVIHSSSGRKQAVQRCRESKLAAGVLPTGSSWSQAAAHVYLILAVHVVLQAADAASLCAILDISSICVSVCALCTFSSFFWLCCCRRGASTLS